MESSPYSLISDRPPRLLGPLITAATIVVIEILSQLGFRLPNPPAFLVLAIVFSAFISGFIPGLVSAGIAWLYLPYFFSIPSQLFRYTDADWKRVLVWGLTLPLTAWMVGALKHRSERIAVMQQSINLLQEQIDLRNQAEQLLRDSEEKYRNLVEYTPVVVYMDNVDKDSSSFYISPQIENLLGYPSSVFAEDPGLWHKLIFPDDYAHAVATIKDTKENGHSTAEYRLVARDGHTLWIRDTSVLVRDEAGHPKYIQGFFEDISRYKQAEEALRESEDFLRLIVDTEPECVKLVAPNGTLIEMNPAGLAMIEADSLNQVHGAPLIELIAPEYQDAFGGLQQRVLHGESGMLEFEIIGLKGTRRWLESHIVPLRNKSNQIEALLGVTRDITARKQAEDERSRQMQVLETSLNEIYMFAVDSLQFTYVNHGARVNLGYSMEELLQLTPVDIKPEFTLEMFSDLLQPLWHHEKNILVFETIHRRKDGTMYPVDVHLQLVETHLDSLFVAIIHDITERKRAEAERENFITELTAKNAELERFTYTVSHDLKSPLVTMKGFLGFLEQDALNGDVERLKNDIKRIAGAVDKMQGLLSDLLELSRIGRFINPPETLAFEELADQAIELIQGRIQARGVTIEVRSNLPMIYGDKTRLREVLQNLIDNAVKYMGDQSDPHIEIGQCGEEDGKPIFYVRDNGMGIAPEYREKIFGLFNKLDATSDGTGIGLALVKRIIEYHDGRIWVESKTGKGSAFCFTLPLQS